MPNPKSDSSNYGSRTEDQERDLGAKGGPVSGLGSPDDKHSISRPYQEDLQSQIAAKSGKKKRGKEKKNE